MACSHKDVQIFLPNSLQVSAQPQATTARRVVQNKLTGIGSCGWSIHTCPTKETEPEPAAMLSLRQPPQAQNRPSNIAVIDIMLCAQFCLPKATGNSCLQKTLICKHSTAAVIRMWHSKPTCFSINIRRMATNADG
jgi:hypothetical protein